MYSWTELRARLAQALGQRQAETQAETQAAQQLVERVLVHLKGAKTVRQVQELQSLAAPWVQEPEQAMRLAQAVERALATIPTHGPSFPRSSWSKTQPAKSTKRHRRAR
jgi:hypothetical protein